MRFWLFKIRHVKNVRINTNVLSSPEKLAQKQVRMHMIRIKMPKICAKSIKTPSWPRINTDWGKIAPTGSPSFSLFASLKIPTQNLLTLMLLLMLVLRKVLVTGFYDVARELACPLLACLCNYFGKSKWSWGPLCLSQCFFPVMSHLFQQVTRYFAQKLQRFGLSSDTRICW